MKKEEIKSLYDLRDYVNQCDEYPLGVEEIVEAHGWTVPTADRDVAIDKTSGMMVTINDEGEADVVTYHGER